MLFQRSVNQIHSYSVVALRMYVQIISDELDADVFYNTLRPYLNGLVLS